MAKQKTKKSGINHVFISRDWWVIVNMNFTWTNRECECFFLVMQGVPGCGSTKEKSVPN